MKASRKTEKARKPRVGILGRFKRGESEADSALNTESSKLIQGEPWTQGHNLSNKALTVLVVGGMLAYPFVANQISDGMSPPAVAQVVEEKASVPPALAQQAQSVAQGFVSAWLTATRDDSSRLERYTKTSTTRLPEKSSEIRELSVSELELVNDSTFRVTVSVEVKDAAGKWQPRAFDVLLTNPDQGSLSILGFPSERAHPAATSKNFEGYPTDLSGNKAVTSSVEGFLQSYLAGNGDLTRFVTPGNTITAIAPAPYSSARIEYVVGDKDPGDKAADGEQVHVNVRMLLTNQTTETLGDFQLTLTARAGRWEVSTLGLDEDIAKSQNKRKGSKK